MKISTGKILSNIAIGICVAAGIDILRYMGIDAILILFIMVVSFVLIEFLLCVKKVVMRKLRIINAAPWQDIITDAATWDGVWVEFNRRKRRFGIGKDTGKDTPVKNKNR